MKKIIFALLFLLSFVPLKSWAQLKNNIIDEVIWVIGDESILRSEVEDQKLRAQYDGTPFRAILIALYRNK